jgi:hypothetical protein
MKMWIARDKTGVICLYKCKPVLKGDYFSEYDNEGHYCIFIDQDLFPEVTFENSPQEVELKLIEK